MKRKRFKNLLQKLEEIFSECNRIGWDGYEGLAITKESYLGTKQFFEDLDKYKMDPPKDIIPEPTGRIGLIWRLKHNIFVISVEDKQKMFCATVIGDERYHFKYPESYIMIGLYFNFNRSDHENKQN